MMDFKILCDCFLCNSKYQFGPSLYDGKYIGPWKIGVCNRCYGANHDGIVLSRWPHLRDHLEKTHASIKLNSRGWLNWPV